ncbi:MAG: hypothetical protein VX185_12365 [Pseudomonadota bacterium]|nr:hypothetical protein [Pseudomonadota bacterium]
MSTLLQNSNEYTSSKSIKELLKDGSYDFIDQQAKKLSSVLDVYSTAAVNAAASLNSGHKDTWVTQKVTQASNKVNSYAAALGTTPPQTLVKQAGQYASRNKGLLLAAGFAIGFGLSRALRATNNKESQEQPVSDTQEPVIALETDIESKRNDLIANNKVLDRAHVELHESNPEFMTEDDVNSVTGDNAQRELYFQDNR